MGWNVSKKCLFCTQRQQVDRLPAFIRDLYVLILLQVFQRLSKTSEGLNSFPCRAAASCTALCFNISPNKCTPWASFCLYHRNSASPTSISFPECFRFQLWLVLIAHSCKIIFLVFFVSDTTDLEMPNNCATSCCSALPGSRRAVIICSLSASDRSTCYSYYCTCILFNLQVFLYIHVCTYMYMSVTVAKLRH